MASMDSCVAYLPKAPRDGFASRRGYSGVLGEIEYIYANSTSYDHGIGLVLR
jgi:hypothetical protein